MKKHSSRGHESIDGYLKQQQNTENLRLKAKLEPMSIEDWIRNNKKRKKRIPPRTKDYTMPSDEFKKAVKEQEQFVKKMKWKK